jgi:hypothetical protein
MREDDDEGGEGEEDDEERRGVTGGRDRLAERLQQDAAEVGAGKQARALAPGRALALGPGLVPKGGEARVSPHSRFS